MLAVLNSHLPPGVSLAIFKEARHGQQRGGGQILVDALGISGVERAFCVPGESYLAVLDACTMPAMKSTWWSVARKAAPPIWPRSTAS